MSIDRTHVKLLAEPPGCDSKISLSTLGKFGNDNDFDEYGASFAKDDVVSAFVDFTGDTVVFSFSKNGEDQVNILSSH